MLSTVAFFPAGSAASTLHGSPQLSPAVSTFQVTAGERIHGATSTNHADLLRQRDGGAEAAGGVRAGVQSHV